MEYMLVLCRADALCGELAHHGTHTIDQQSVFYSTSSTPPAIMFDVEYCTHLCSLRGKLALTVDPVTPVSPFFHDSQ